jgi:hypothetical protein
MNWTQLLDPANGGPGESPGYQEALAAIRAKPYARAVRKAKGKAEKKPVQFPALKHAAAPD